MQISKFIYLRLIIILLFTTTLYCQNYWKYKMTPEKHQWSSMTYKEKIASQQIPIEKLKKMTTEEVFQAWMDLPGRLEVLAFNSMQKGFEVTKERFNVLNELLQRTDVGSVVLKRYLSIDLNSLMNSKTLFEKGKFITDFGFTEFFLSQPEVLKSLSQNEKNQLLKKISRGLITKQAFDKEKKDYFWIESSLILAGRILDIDNYSQFHQFSKGNTEVKNALQRGDIKSKTEFQLLYKKINEIINNL